MAVASVPAAVVTFRTWTLVFSTDKTACTSGFIVARPTKTSCLIEFPVFLEWISEKKGKRFLRMESVESQSRAVLRSGLNGFEIPGRVCAQTLPKSSTPLYFWQSSYFSRGLWCNSFLHWGSTQWCQLDGQFFWQQKKIRLHAAHWRSFLLNDTVINIYGFWKCLRIFGELSWIQQLLGTFLGILIMIKRKRRFGICVS